MIKPERFLINLAGIFTFAGLFYFMIAVGFVPVIKKGDSSMLILAGIVAIFMLFSSVSRNMLVPTATGIALGAVAGAIYHPESVSIIFTIMTVLNLAGLMLGFVSLHLWLGRHNKK
jgi:hypothetical protein